MDVISLTYNLLENINENYRFLTILLSIMFIFWSYIYNLLRYIFSNQTDEFVCRIVTVLHGLMAVIMCTLLLVSGKKNPFNSDNYGNNLDRNF